MGVPHPELGHLEEPDADPSRAPAPLQSPARRRQVPRGRGEERAAAWTYLSAVRPRGCAREPRPGGGAELRCPGAAPVRPPARSPLPHHPPPPLGRGRPASVRRQRPALPRRATLGSPRRLSDRGTGLSPGPGWFPCSPGPGGDARQRGGLDGLLGSFRNLEAQESFDNLSPPTPLCHSDRLGPGTFCPSGSSRSVRTLAINRATYERGGGSSSPWRSPHEPANPSEGRPVPSHWHPDSDTPSTRCLQTGMVRLLSF